MPHIELPSNAEQQASKAATLSAFAGLSLPSVRSDLTQLLELIRANSFFEEYTKHDISHIDRMLSLLDWLIPAETKAIMTPADWLLIVLATYFHDLGMLVTRDEYDNRNSTAFAGFKTAILADETQATQDYLARVHKLPDDEAEKFLYQEYVRQNHASRIRAWIEGRKNTDLGITEAAAAEIARILNPLQEVFREDLATACESHHLSDLDNVTKYPISRPYGSTEQEAANVQYAAVLLRTIDLLDITSDRVPSIAFRIINPRDPISQREWAKQAAVRNVRPKVATDDEGNLNPALPKEAIEVHARFENAEGYFGLTAYLAYAEAQVRQSHDWIALSNRRFGSLYSFPWRSIDISSIEAKGFIPRPFSFSLNQDKILELLTGHTLYNESSVVVRELIQNAIDAVRLEHGDNVSFNGKIELKWDSINRILEVCDNGTGMTQEIIEQNFLSVGSSYYESTRFREMHPSFNAISRFGIGVLTTFMVADQVEVITCHAEEPDARKLELRTVHGQYLIRLLDKATDPQAKMIGPHGTVVRLFLRPTATLEDVIHLVQRWIIVPACNITARVDEGEPIKVGYDSVAAALEATVSDHSSSSIDDQEGEDHIRIIQSDFEGVSLAYAVRWSRYFKEWQFVASASLPRLGNICTCVEGVRVQAGTPGFISSSRSAGVAAIANLTGPGAPRTNVARSSFEHTPEYERSLKQIYLLYVQHVTDELNKMQADRHQSLTWAASEAAFLLRPVSDRESAVSKKELRRALKSVPLLLLEEEGTRRAVSAEDLAKREFFWTIDGALPSHIEYLLREIPEPVSLTQLLESLRSTGVDLPQGPLLCTRLSGDLNEELILDSWQIVELRGNEERRRSEARWVKTGGATAWSAATVEDDIDLRWRRLPTLINEALRTTNVRHRLPRNMQPIRIPIRGVTASGFGAKHSAISIDGQTYLLPGTQWTNLLKIREGEPPLQDRGPTDEGILALGFALLTNSIPLDVMEERIIRHLERSNISDFVDIPKLMELRGKVEWRVYDTRQWQRWGSSEYGEVF